MTPVTVLLPLPPRELSPNARVFWKVKSLAIKEYRGYARIAGLEAKQKHDVAFPLTGLVTAQLAFTFKVKRDHDPDNLTASCKVFFDGIVDAGILSGDTTEHLKLLPPTVAYGPKPGVVLTLTGETK